MSSINKVILIGNLGQDPEVRYTPNGTAVSNLSIATSRSWKDKEGEKVEETEWHRVVVYDRLAEICGEYLAKGSKVYIEGRLKTRKWQDKDGNDKYTTEIVTEEMRMLSSRNGGGDQDAGEQQRRSGNGGGQRSNGNGQRSNGGGQRSAASQQRGQGSQRQQQKSNTGFDDMDDDIPF